MEWSEKNLQNLESINVLELNINQIGFYKAMKKLASIGVQPSYKQLIYIKRLADNQSKVVKK